MAGVGECRDEGDRQEDGYRVVQARFDFKEGEQPLGYVNAGAAQQQADGGRRLSGRGLRR